MVPAEFAVTDRGGASVEETASQKPAVAGTASTALPGQAGTEKAAVLTSLVGGMITEGVSR